MRRRDPAGAQRLGQVGDTPDGTARSRKGRGDRRRDAGIQVSRSTGGGTGAARMEGEDPGGTGQPGRGGASRRSAGEAAAGIAGGSSGARGGTGPGPALPCPALPARPAVSPCSPPLPAAPRIPDPPGGGGGGAGPERGAGRGPRCRSWSRRRGTTWGLRTS